MALAAARSFAGRGGLVSRRRRGDWFAGLVDRRLGFVALLLVWQTSMLFALFEGIIGLGPYSGIHCFGCFALAACLIWRLKASSTDDRYAAALQMLIWSAVAGPFGAFVAAALSLSAVPNREEAVREDASERLTAEGSEDEQTKRLHTSFLDCRVRIEGASSVHPLMDVIADGAQPAKLEALGVIYRKYEPQLNAVLKRALQDSDTSVRVLAATITAKLHATYSGKIGELQAAAAVKPELSQHWRDLGEVRLEYAVSGLPESSRARAQIELAVADLSRAAELEPTNRVLADRLDQARRQLAEWGR